MRIVLLDACVSMKTREKGCYSLKTRRHFYFLYGQVAGTPFLYSTLSFKLTTMQPQKYAIKVVAVYIAHVAVKPQIHAACKRCRIEAAFTSDEEFQKAL